MLGTSETGIFREALVTDYVISPRPAARGRGGEHCPRSRLPMNWSAFAGRHPLDTPLASPSGADRPEDEDSSHRRPAGLPRV